MERWVEIKDVPNYEVSNLGNVRNKRTGKLLAKMLNKEGGYERVNIGGKHRYIHRLVADAFYEGDHSNMDITHVDGDRRNNTVSNLECRTRKENIRHSIINGLKYPAVVKVVRCKFCKHRHDDDVCKNKPDDFFCSYGERE